MLEFKLKYEHNPLLVDRLESLRVRALEFIRGDEEPPQYLINWFTKKIEAFVNIEKVFYHQDIKGKVNSNYVFNVKEYFETVFAKYNINSDSSRNDSKRSLIPRTQKGQARSSESKGSNSPNKIKWARVETSAHKDIKRLELVPNDIDLFSRSVLKDRVKAANRENAYMFESPSDLSIVDTENGAVKKTIHQMPPIQESASAGHLNIKKKIPVRIPIPIHTEFIQIDLDKGTSKPNSHNRTLKISSSTSIGFHSPNQNKYLSASLNPQSATFYQTRKNVSIRKGL